MSHLEDKRAFAGAEPLDPDLQAAAGLVRALTTAQIPVVVISDDLKVRFASELALTIAGAPKDPPTGKAFSDVFEGWAKPLETRPEEDMPRIDWTALDAGGWIGTIVDRRVAGGNAHHADELTGLGNRSALRDVSAEAMAQTPDGTLTLLFLDLDRFKIVNDTLGHAAGDQLLKKVAERLKKAVRENDTVVRMGGDEFAVILGDQINRASVEDIANRVIEYISKPFLLDGNQVRVGVSIGLSETCPGEPDTSEALRRADIALYASKRRGRGQFHWYDAQMSQAIRHRQDIEDGLRRAIILDELVIEYQPEIVFADGRIRAFEALVRWNRPEQGLLHPVAFLAVAEESGIVLELGQWVLRNACTAALDWPEEIMVSVNVSPVQFHSKGFDTTVKQVLERTGLPSHRLELEITEAVLIADDLAVDERMEALHKLGVSIALDDFGTGYSSLNYLRRFKFDQIKIDQSYVQNDDPSKTDKALIDTINRLGKAFGMDVLAEGVETQKQLDEMIAGGIGSAQGFLIARPLPVGQVPDFIAQHRSRVPKNASRGSN
ncbi:MAG: EAL domain-containing protein [Rhodobacteraceae bacterium]|nr:EAL domain-containing protein [Paracoccaceae bacterium]